VNLFGICARLWHRDGKAGYPLHLPRTLDYRREACALYSKLAEHAASLERRAVPELVRANSKDAAAAVSA
jgi:aminoglycoside/choline kinase family phosphotransferase